MDFIFTRDIGKIIIPIIIIFIQIYPIIKIENFSLNILGNYLLLISINMIIFIILMIVVDYAFRGWVIDENEFNDSSLDTGFLFIMGIFISVILALVFP